MYEKNETHYPDGAGIVRNAYTREMMGIKACKSVFVCGNLLVFLGAGIEDYHPEYGRHVITTVNNVRLLAGSFVDAAGKKMGELVSGTYDGQMRYIRNDGMLYGILPSSRNRLSVMAGGKRTHWAYLNFQNRQVPDEEIQVLELMIDHGGTSGGWRLCLLDLHGSGEKAFRTGTGVFRHSEYKQGAGSLLCGMER